jgi:hypothetical protein
MTDEEHGQEGDEEAIEDLEAPAAAAQWDFAGGLAPCRPTNRCRPVNTVVHCPDGITQGCREPTCRVTEVYYQ